MRFVSLNLRICPHPKYPNTYWFYITDPAAPGCKSGSPFPITTKFGLTKLRHSYSAPWLLNNPSWNKSIQTLILKWKFSSPSKDTHKFIHIKFLIENIFQCPTNLKTKKENQWHPMKKEKKDNLCQSMHTCHSSNNCDHKYLDSIHLLRSAFFISLVWWLHNCMLWHVITKVSLESHA